MYTLLLIVQYHNVQQVMHSTPLYSLVPNKRSPSRLFLVFNFPTPRLLLGPPLIKFSTLWD